MEEAICMTVAITSELEEMHFVIETLANQIPRDHNLMRWISSALESPFFLWKICNMIMRRLQEILEQTVEDLILLVHMHTMVGLVIGSKSMAQVILQLFTFGSLIPILLLTRILLIPTMIKIGSRESA